MKYLRRMMWFIAIRMCLFTICVSILVCVFYIAFNLGNAYVLISEGLEKRVSVVLTRQDAVELNDYFTADFLNADPVLANAFSESSPYLAYAITGFDHSADLESLWGWPWSSTIECTVAERVLDITGSAKAAYSSQVAAKPPTWKGGRYRIWLQKTAGAWKIVGMRQISELPDPQQ